MKKSIFIAVLGVGMASVVSSYGQGNVFFSNYYSSVQTTGITYLSGPAAGLGVGPEISVELLYGASTDTLTSQMTAIVSSLTAVGEGVATGPGAIQTSETGAGWFTGGNVVVPGTAGSTYAFALEAFGTYESVNYIGYSPIFTGSSQSTSSAPVPSLPTGLLQGSFTVSPVPEPTTLALAGLGGLASLMAFRRKKA